MIYFYILRKFKTFNLLTIFFSSMSLYVNIYLGCTRVIESIRLSRKARLRYKVFKIISSLIIFLRSIDQKLIFSRKRAPVINISIYIILISVVNIAKLIYWQIEYPLDIQRMFNLLIARA